MNTDSTLLKIDVEQPRTWARRLTITVPAERVVRERDAMARRIAQRVKLPGFRKGHVPAHVLEKQYGAAIERETLEHLVSEAYREAVRQEGLHPITQAAVEGVDYTPGQDLTFRVEFEVRPEIELARVGGFRIEQPPVQVSESEVASVLQRLRTEQATWKPHEGSAPSTGDRVAVEITPVRDADAESVEPRRYEIVLGEGQAVPDVESAIQTLAPDSEGEFVIRIAEEADGAGGREQRVRIRLIEVKRPELPALDDAFAASLGDFADLATLRARVTADLEREARAEAERELRRRLMDEILAANPVEVPDAMVQQYLEGVLPAGDGFDPERLAEFRSATRPAAERAIQRMLVLDRVAKTEGLEATSEEVEQRVQELAARYDRPPPEVRSQLQKSGRLGALAEEITEEKVFSYLKSMSTIE